MIRRFARVRSVWLIVVTLLLSAFVVAVPSGKANAITAGDWNAGNIISDAVFFNGNAMTASDVQSFLNSQMPNCLPMSYLGPDPVIGIYITAEQRRPCLRDFTMDTTTITDPQGFCAPFYGAAGDSAASIIAKVGQACGVSQKVLLVKLQKEQRLVGDRMPDNTQYDRATGYSCYDNPFWCDPEYAGFFKQMYFGARQLQRYNNVPEHQRFRVGTTVNIQWHPNAACGSSPVYLANRATAALYYYTPYQPNPTALSNLRGGQNDGCSSYGNRNFWVMFNDWFGSTQIEPGTEEFVKAAYFDVLGRVPDATGLSYWVGRVGAGMSRAEFSNYFNNSDEYRMNKIIQAYQLAFNRAPDPSGADYWLNAMRRGQISPEDIYSTFLFSDEMFYVHGGGTNEGYVTAMYRSLLTREPDAGGLNYWATRLAQGSPRRSVSDSIWYSPERYDLRVIQSYQAFLGRTPGAGEIAYWSGVARSQGTTAMRTGLMSSGEYWAYANVRY